MNENLDAGIGMVLDRIEELGVADNTCVIYTADNGYELKKDKGKPVAERQFYQAFPQRSHKYTVSEGGIRVPFIVRGPGIPAGSHSGSPVVGTDIFPTVMDLASGSKHIPKRVEGASLTAHLKSGGKDAIDRKDSFFVFKYFKPNGRHDVAIVDGDYKLIKDIDVDERYLFNLAQDVGESDNLANDEPERVDSLYGAMTSYFARFGWDESQAKAEGKSEKQRKKKTGQQSDNVRAITRPVSTLVETTSSDKPDVLFIAIDDMNDWTTLFDDDNPIQTPNLKRLAARGAFFSKAYCAVPACNPSRTAILTGLSPVTSGVYGNGQSWKELLPDVVTLPQYFGQHGFTTKGGGKIFHHGGTGTDREDNPSFDEFFKLRIHSGKPETNYNGYKRGDEGVRGLATQSWDWGVHDVDKQTDEFTIEYVLLRLSCPLVIACVLTSGFAVAEDRPVPTVLAQRGTLILHDTGSKDRGGKTTATFSGTTMLRAAAGSWQRAVGAENVWRSTWKPGMGHVPVASYQGFEVKDLIVEVTFRYGQMTEPWHHQCFRIAADSRPDITGHIVSAWANPNNDFIESGFLLQHVRKTPEKKIIEDLLLDRQLLTVEPNTWYTAILEIVGDESLFRMGDHVAYAQADQIEMRKNLVSLTLGSTWHEIKQVRIWEATPNPDWEAMKTDILQARKPFEPIVHNYKK